MRAGAGQQLADPREAVLRRLEQHEPTDADRPRRSSPFRRARDRERHLDPHHMLAVHAAG
jgi:hypothetical protein